MSTEEKLAEYRKRKEAELESEKRREAWVSTLTLQPLRRRVATALTPHQNDTTEDEEVEEKERDWLDWSILCLKFGLWLVSQILFVKLEFGAVFFLFSSLGFMYFNMGDRKRKLKETDIMSNSKRASFVDSTVRFEWELTKEKFDSCEYNKSIDSVKFIVQFGTETSQWMIRLYPKGHDGFKRNIVSIYLDMIKGDMVYEVLYEFAIKTDNGYWPKGDLVKKLYSRRGVDYEFLKPIAKDQDDMPGDDYFCTTEQFSGQFAQNKVAIVATLVFHMKDSKPYLQQQEVADAYMEDVRSLPLQEIFSDVTVICGEEQFPSHRSLLAARSKYFEALFRNEPTKKEVKIEEASPEIVKEMLDFMSKGLIPADIDAKARDLVMVADMYRIQLLSIVHLPT